MSLVPYLIRDIILLNGEVTNYISGLEKLDTRKEYAFDVEYLPEVAVMESRVKGKGLFVEQRGV